MNVTVLAFDTIDSTNTEALNQARQGAEEGLCIVARQQTAGRGRHGRTWASEKDAGLYFSIVLRPKISVEFLPLITLMAGIAVHDTLQELGLKPDIKWVNDVLVNEKKIGGILAETTETNDGFAVVVGIGINLKPSEQQPETATSIDECRGLTVREGSEDRNGLVDSLIRFLTYFYDILNSDPSQIIDEWRRRSTYFSGMAVKVTLHDETMNGTTDGLQPNGALRLMKADGTVTIIQAGDVERLRADPQVC